MPMKIKYNYFKLVALLLSMSFLLAYLKPVKAESSLHLAKAKDSLLLKISHLNSGRLVTVGERGHVLFSDDQGSTWTQANVPVRSTLTSVFFINDQTGWAVGHDTNILRTDDGGENWLLQYTAPVPDDPSQPLDERPLFDITFINKNIGFSVGAYGIFLSTTNGGSDWNEQYLESLDDPEFGLPHIYQIKKLSDGQLIMTGEAGFIALGDGELSNWKRAPVDYQGSFFSVNQLSDGILLASGLRGNVYRSVDKGISWLSIDSKIKTIGFPDALIPGGRAG